MRYRIKRVPGDAFEYHIEKMGWQTLWIWIDTGTATNQLLLALEIVVRYELPRTIEL